MFGRKSRTTTASATPPAPARPVIEVRYIKSQYYSSCPTRGACPMSPREGRGWIAIKPKRQASVEALYVHLHQVHGMPVADIEALPVKDM